MSEGYKPLVQSEELGQPTGSGTTSETVASDTPPAPPPTVQPSPAATVHPVQQPQSHPPSQQDYPPSYQPSHMPPPPAPVTAAGGYQPVGMVPQYGQAYSTNSTVIVQQQPYAAVQVAPFPKPNNYMVLSILNMLFCCFICGLIAVIYGSQVDTHYQAGRFEEAKSASRTARNLNIASLVSAAVGMVIFVGISLLGFFLRASDPEY